MTRRIIITSIAAAFVALSAGAVKQLSLEDCRRMAVENNAAVRVAEGNRQAATEVSREAFTKYFPNISAQWLGYKSNKGALQYTLPNLGDFIPELGNFPLGEIELIKKGWTGGLTAVQPIFLGGRIVNGNRLAHVGETVADLRKDGAVDKVLVTAEEYYWQIITLKSKKCTLESVMQMVDTLERQVAVAVKAGVAMRNDLLKVQLRRNELRSMMVDLDNGITLSSNLLAQYVGLDGDTIDIIGDRTPDNVPPYPSDIYIKPSEALTSTVDYRLLEQNVKASDLRTRIAVGESMPEVGLGAGLIYDRLFNQDHHFAAVMLTVNVPITDWWGGSHKIKKAKIEAQNARIEQENLSQMLELKMQNAWDELTASHRKMAIAHESIGQSAENLRLNRNYYDAGICTITDLLDAQTLYRQSLDSYAEAYGNYRLRRAQYLSATARNY